jgi:hypothetical protein
VLQLWRLCYVDLKTNVNEEEQTETRAYQLLSSLPPHLVNKVIGTMFWKSMEFTEISDKHGFQEGEARLNIICFYFHLSSLRLTLFQKGANILSTQTRN